MVATEPATPLSLVEQVYERLPERVAIGRERLGRPLTFAENFCDLDGRGVDPGSQPVAVSLAAAALVLPDNQIRSTWDADGLAVRAAVAFIGDQQPAVTATGNITDGEIIVNWQPLQPPWQPLNIRLS